VIPAYWHEGLPAYGWQVTLHALVLGSIFYAWARRLRLPSGIARRRLLAVLLAMPLVTAAVPGRSALEFRGRSAWFDSGRVLATPLGIGRVRLYHFALAAGALTATVSMWQEIAPAFRRSRRRGSEAPDDVVQAARALPGWERIRVIRTAGDTVMVATGGWPGRPRLIVSQGALERLGPAERRAVLRHEHAHWKPGRWLATHALFAVRLVQLYNPVALWAFREYCLEQEIACDAEATAAGDRTALGRALLTVYAETDRRDVAARSALRKRVDLLLDDAAAGDGLPVATIVTASSVMLLVLPWLV
jgi:Zn-dependent protease with chaperone function